MGIKVEYTNKEKIEDKISFQAAGSYLLQNVQIIFVIHRELSENIEVYVITRSSSSAQYKRWFIKGCKVYPRIHPMDKLEGPSYARSLEDSLCEAILRDDYQFVVHYLARGADPNKVTSQGKTSLGEAASTGNFTIVKLLIEASQPTNNSKLYLSPHRRRHKKKTIQNRHVFGKEVKLNNASVVRGFMEKTDFSEVPKATKPEDKEKYFSPQDISSSTSSDEGRKTARSSPCISPQADLEWDEEMGTAAPNTKEDDTWSSLYKWYATILERTGAAIESASSMINGIDQQDAFRRTALHYAVEQCHIPIVKALLDAGCRVNITAAEGLTPLYIAAIKDHSEIAQMLISAGSNVNYKTHEKITPLHFASSRGYLNMVKTLVDNGAFIESRDTNDRTPLYLAASRGHSGVVQYLISIGANVNGETVHGYTPLCEAVWKGYSNVVKLLLKAGARVTHSHKLLHTAVLDRNVEIVKMLAKANCGINLHNDNGDTPLLLAVRTSQPKMVRALLENGANVNVSNSITWCNALHVAVESIKSSALFEEILLSLVEYKINMDTLALTGDSALNRALVLQKDDAAVLLIRYGANVNTSCDMYTCGLDNLSIASRRKTINLASMLLKAGHYPMSPELHIAAPTEVTACWLAHASRQPLNLTDICRIKIRKMGNDEVLFRYIDSLPLPKCLKRYLMLEDEGA